ncbi:serine protease grass isoform X1 [Drosophila elegans]|uniref:serine protease grass isoform X1 n=1 Tax=Drosophila elegans TaxID=30023 RepID=UPI0007E79A94|nr:serine protease grass isoform X1 [Drosophila elegans]
MRGVIVAIAALAIWVFGLSVTAEYLEDYCGYAGGVTLRVAGGQDAIINSNPWMAFIHSSTELICGGSLITRRFVLTAAHCVNEGMAVKVRLGEYDETTTVDCVNEDCIPETEEFNVDMGIRHGKFSEEGNLHDIALLRLDRAVTYKRHIKPICIILDTSEKPAFERLEWFVAMGWGETKSNRKKGPLKTVVLQRFNNERCWESFTRLVHENQFCAGSREGDTCNGDSGGPLIRNVTHMGMVRAAQFGVVSYGSRDCTGIGVYTSVMHYADWIATVVRMNTDTAAPRMPRT